MSTDRCIDCDAELWATNRVGEQCRQCWSKSFKPDEIDEALDDADRNKNESMKNRTIRQRHGIKRTSG